jgi:hypothetical protein
MAASLKTTVSDDTMSLTASNDADTTQLNANRVRAEKNPEECIDWDRETDQWTMLVKLATADIDDDVDFVKIHRTIFQMMMTADDKLTFVTKDGTTLKSTKQFPKGEAYKEAFTTRETKNMFLTAHPVNSKRTLDELKRRSPELIEYLKLHNIYIDLSATGSLTEVVLGPWFGVHPDFTSKHRMKIDLRKLISLNAGKDSPFADMLAQAKENLTFGSHIPDFQLRTRRIKREVNGVEYSAKATMFICAQEHRDFWEEILVAGMDDGYLAPLGRFYLLQREDQSPALAAAISWHNSTLNSMKAIIIRGIKETRMDAGIISPHELDERPTLRDKLHQGGFITVISTNENEKWIGIAKDAETATRYVNMDLKDLCAAAYSDGTAPTAAAPERKVRNRRFNRNEQASIQDDKTALFERQTKSWADIAAYDIDATTAIHTESNVARRPRTNRRSKIRFDITEVVVPNKPDEETKISTTDTMTALTHDDLRTLKDEISAQLKHEISSAMSEMSTNSTAQTTNEAFQAKINEQINENNREMNENNKEMRETMKSMKDMMMSMKQLMESKTQAYDRPSDDEEEDYYDGDSDHEEEPAMEEDSDDFKEDAEDSKEATKSDGSDNDEIDDPSTSEHKSESGSRRSKRSATRPKGESPAGKKANSLPTTGRTASGRGGRGRGAAAGRVRERTPPPRKASKKTVRKNLELHYEPLSMSNATSTSGLN